MTQPCQVDWPFVVLVAVGIGIAAGSLGGLVSKAVMHRDDDTDVSPLSDATVGSWTAANLTAQPAGQAAASGHVSEPPGDDLLSPPGAPRPG